jgi:hypothetical protein
MSAGEQLQPPAEYAAPWLVYAAFAVIAVAVYYLTVWRITRPRKPRPVSASSARRASLDRLDSIEADVRTEHVSPRRGHQLISETVRRYAADLTGLVAQTMTLEDLRGAATPKLVDLLVLLYPPEFAPGDELPRASFDDALAKARELVGSWT